MYSGRFGFFWLRTGIAVSKSRAINELLLKLGGLPPRVLLPLGIGAAKTWVV